ncbi:MAG: DedA family protein [Actinomycetota bacterium]
MTDYLGIVLDTVRQVEPWLRLLIAFAGMFCETSILIGLLVPGDTIVLVSATAVGSWAEWAALLVTVIVGALCGESVGFALGRWFGPRIQHSRLGRRLGEKNWLRARNYLARRGGAAVFISRFLPVLHALIPLTVGMSSMRYRRFIAWTAPACTVWAAAYVSVGWLAAGSYRQLSGQLHYAGLVFAGIIVVFLVAALLIRRAVERIEARHMHHDSEAHDGEGTPGP